MGLFDNFTTKIKQRKAQYDRQQAESKAFHDILEKKAKVARRQAYAEGYLKGQKVQYRKKGAIAGAGEEKSGMSGALSSIGSWSSGAVADMSEYNLGINESDLFGGGSSTRRRHRKK